MNGSIEPFKPDWVSSPGETISEFLEVKNLTVSNLALEINESSETIAGIIRADVEITQDLAEKLARSLGASSEFWMRREEAYRHSVSQIDEGLKLLEDLPIKDMIGFGWIEKPKNREELLQNCLRFFEIEKPSEWQVNFRDVIENAAFRTTPAFESSTGAVAAWLRRGELEAREIRCKSWNPSLFKEALSEIRELSRITEPSKFLKPLTDICASCGVALVLLRAPSRCRASGATRFISNEKALLLLSFRYLSDDHFWFTFFHEAAHLILHGHRSLFVDSAYKSDSADETEANNFAANILIPTEFRHELSRLGNDPRAVIRFARRIGISRGVVVGQMQHLGFLRRNQLNNLKTFYSWG